MTKIRVIDNLVVATPAPYSFPQPSMKELLLGCLKDILSIIVIAGIFAYLLTYTTLNAVILLVIFIWVLIISFHYT